MKPHKVPETLQNSITTYSRLATAALHEIRLILDPHYYVETRIAEATARAQAFDERFQKLPLIIESKVLDHYFYLAQQNSGHSRVDGSVTPLV